MGIFGRRVEEVFVGGRKGLVFNRGSGKVNVKLENTNFPERNSQYTALENLRIFFVSNHVILFSCSKPSISGWALG